MFKIIWSEIRTLLHGSKSIFILSVLAFAFSCIAINMTVYNYTLAKEEQQAYEESYGDKVFYKLDLPGESEVYQRVFGDKYREVLKSVFEQLKADPLFQYRYTTENPVFFFNDSGIPDVYSAYKDECLSGYEDGSASTVDYLALKAFYVDNLFQNEPRVTLAAGEWFTDEDFYVNDPDNMNVPVILGSAYQDLYKIGDVISHAHLATENDVTLHVIGFFDADSYFYDNNNEKRSLTRYMAVPSLETSYDYILEDGSYEEFFRLAYDSSKLVNARIVCGKEDAALAEQRVYEILNQNKLYEFKLSAESEASTKGLEETKSQTVSSMAISIFIVLLSILMFAIQTHYKLLKNKKKYGIYTLTGIVKWQLFFIMIIDTLLLFLLSNALFVLINTMLSGTLVAVEITGSTVMVIAAMELLLVCFIGVLGYTRVNQLNMSGALREQE